MRERSDTKDYVIKLVQKNFFGALYYHIKSLNGDICFNFKVKKYLKIAFSPLKTLSVFCDRIGFLCSHSRIINANMLYNVSFLIILPKQHNFVELLIPKVHYELGHFGSSFVLARIQRRFWILRGQSSMCGYLKSYTFCQLKNAKSSS